MVRPIFNSIKISAIALMLIGVGFHFPTLSAAAQNQSEEVDLGVLDPFAPNPLLSQEPDPLLPNPPRDGNILSESEQETLAPELDRLNAEATALLAAGNAIAAFELWTRELRLRRYFGPLEEIAALERVGLISWENGQRLYLEFITDRLHQILLNSPDQTILEALGNAFQTVRAKDYGIQAYQRLLEIYAEDNIWQKEGWLNAIAVIYLNWLDYPQAAAAYRELLRTQQQIENLRQRGELPPPPPPIANGNPPPSRLQSLRNLAFIYEQMGEFLEAIATREQLVEYHLGQSNLGPIPDLKIAIATNHEQLGQFQQAGQAYQQAYQFAINIQQFENASIALARLAQLYMEQNQTETALELYQAKLLVNQRSFNFFSMMNTYDNIGEIHRQKQAYPQALQAFQRALQLAQQLQHKEDYFLAKIDEINRQIR